MILGLLPASADDDRRPGPAARFALLTLPFWRGKAKIPNEDPRGLLLGYAPLGGGGGGGGGGG